MTVPVLYALLYHSSIGIVITLFLIRAVLDCLDGSVARTCDTTSEFGRLFDKISDNTFLLAVISVLFYIILVKYGLFSWKTGLLVVVGILMLQNRILEFITDQHDSIDIFTNNWYTLINFVYGAIAWYIANQF